MKEFFLMDIKKQKFQVKKANKKIEKANKKLEEANKKIEEEKRKAVEEKEKTIINMHENNMDVNTISKITFLSVSKIKKIITKYDK